ncbi:SPDEF factor, partial [Odontophorus gujanensis]|nr:SPDEF factor [Odontophorus gujanensis]
PSPPGTPFCLHYFAMLYSEDVAWAAKGMGETSQSGAPGGRGEVKKEPEQCPIIDSQGLGLGGDGELQGGLPLEEHSLEQMQSMVVGEVLKDIETACKLLNIAAGGSAWLRCAPQSLFQGGAAHCPHPYACPYGAAEVRTPLFSLAVPGPNLRVHPPPHPIPPCAGGDSGWVDSEVDSSCAGQPIHLWQFLKELLLKPHNYGRFIRWLNKEKGIFKIEDSAQVARLWGIRKNRPAMNYDKLSRSIRQYYKKGIIRKPDISQRLVYQFVHPL